MGTTLTNIIRPVFDIEKRYTNYYQVWELNKISHEEERVRGKVGMRFGKVVPMVV